MERMFFRERLDESEWKKEKYIEQKKIAVTGLSRSAGTTFVASALAFYFRDMGKKVTFTQCLEPLDADHLFYDAVAMDKRFARRSFVDFYRKIVDEEPLRNLENREAGINWILPVPQKKTEETATAKALSERQRARLSSAAKGEVCIFDIEADFKWNHLLLDMDVLVVVVDPLPSKMIQAAERFKMLKKLELSGCSVVWMVNHMNPGVSKRQVKSYLKTGDIYWIPSFDEEAFYEAEYTCRFLWENEEIKRKMLEIFTKVSHFKVSL